MQSVADLSKRHSRVRDDTLGNVDRRQSAFTYDRIGPSLERGRYEIMTVRRKPSLGDEDIARLDIVAMVGERFDGNVGATNKTGRRK